MLFDLEVDPGERHNLVASSAHASVLAELRHKTVVESAAINQRREAFRAMVPPQPRSPPARKK
jgi:hypothetical protein